MSRRGYWVSRNGKKFEAASWETLCQWAQEGRLKLTDEFITPENSQWRSIEREPTLSTLIPQRERLVLKRGEMTYRAPNYELIQTWAKQGQVSPDDLIYSSYTQLWTRVSELKNIMSCIPEAVIKKTEERQQRRRGVEAFQTSPSDSRVAVRPNDHFEQELKERSDEKINVIQESKLTSEVDQSVLNSPHVPFENTEDVQSLLLQEKTITSKSTETTEETFIMSEDELATDAVVAILKPSETVITELCAPIYDAARLFIILKDLRPLDRIKGECFLKSLRLDCQGMSKKESLTLVLDGMIEHRQQYLANEVSATSIGALAIYRHLSEFIDILSKGLDIVGTIDEERFVIGNQNRPKMTADEATLMINLHSAVEQMIHAVRVFKQ